jgi:hypothetical protein
VHLGWLSESRVRARALGLARIAVLKVRVIVEPGPRPKVHTETLVRLLEREPNRFRRHGDSGIEMRFTPDEGEHPFRLIEHLLARLEEQPPKR